MYKVTLCFVNEVSYPDRGEIKTKAKSLTVRPSSEFQQPATRIFRILSAFPPACRRNANEAKHHVVADVCLSVQQVSKFLAEWVGEW